MSDFWQKISVLQAVTRINRSDNEYYQKSSFKIMMKHKTVLRGALGAHRANCCFVMTYEIRDNEILRGRFASKNTSGCLKIYESHACRGCVILYLVYCGNKWITYITMQKLCLHVNLLSIHLSLSLSLSISLSLSLSLSLSIFSHFMYIVT